MITASEFARRKRCNRATIKAMIARGEIEAVKPGNEWLIDEGLLDVIEIKPRGWKKGRPRKRPRDGQGETK